MIFSGFIKNLVRKFEFEILVFLTYFSKFENSSTKF